MAGYERPVSPVYCPNRIQRSGSSLRTGGRPGRFLMPPVLGDAGADSPARRVMDTPHHLCTAPTESSAPAFPSGREESGRLFWGVALSRARTFSRGTPQYVIYSPARQRAKNRQPLTHSGKQGLPVFVLGFLPHRGRGIGGLSPGWPGASCSDTGSCSARYKPVHRHLFPPRESCAPADQCPASGGFPPG